MPKLIIEIDLTHDSLQGEYRFKTVADRLAEVAGRIERNSYDTLADGKLRADGFVPSECGTIKITA